MSNLKMSVAVLVVLFGRGLCSGQADDFTSAWRSIKQTYFETVADSVNLVTESLDQLEIEARKSSDIARLKQVKQMQQDYFTSGAMPEALDTNKFDRLRTQAVVKFEKEKTEILGKILNAKMDELASAIQDEFDLLADLVVADVFARWSLALADFDKKLNDSKMLILDQFDLLESSARKLGNFERLESVKDARIRFKDEGIIPEFVSRKSFDKARGGAEEGIADTKRQLLAYLLQNRKDKAAEWLNSSQITKASTGRHAELLDHSLSYKPVQSSQSQRLAIFPLSSIEAKMIQSDWADRLEMKSDIENSIGMRLALIPPGRFEMGSPSSEKRRDADEFLHQVEILHPFFIGIHEVTQEQYIKVMSDNPSEFQGNNLPVDRVNWSDAMEFCRRLNKHPAELAASRYYRLPTEAEWQYAARAGTETKFYAGDDKKSVREFGWFREETNRHPKSVGGKSANAWGVFDMMGNVSEWCSDWYSSDYFEKSPEVNPLGPAAGREKIHLGGSWYDTSNDDHPHNPTPRIADRKSRQPNSRFNDLGFRVVCMIESK